MEELARKFLLEFKFSITTYSCTSFIEPGSTEADRGVSAITNNRKTPISVQTLYPIDPNRKDKTNSEKNNVPMDFEYIHDSNEWIGIYEFQFKAFNTNQPNSKTEIEQESVKRSDHIHTKDSIEFEIRVSNQTLDDRLLNDSGNHEIEPQNLDTQMVMLGEITNWLTQEQKIIENEKSKISQLSQIKNAQSIIIEQNNLNSLLSKSLDQLTLIPGAEDNDMDALVSFPRRMFRTSIEIKPLVNMKYRLVQSPAFCGLETVYMEVNISNSLSDGDGVNSTESENVGMQYGILVTSLRVESNDLILKKIGQIKNDLPSETKMDYKLFNDTEKHIDILSDMRNKENQNEKNCLNNPVYMKPNEVWSEIFSISIPNYETHRKSGKETRNYETNHKGERNKNESKITSNLSGELNLDKNPSLSIIAKGYILNSVDGDESAESINEDSSLLEYKINVDIDKILKNVTILNAIEDGGLNQNPIFKNRVDAIDQSTLSFVQILGGSEGIDLSNSVGIDQGQVFENSDSTFYENQAGYISSVQQSPAMEHPNLKFSPLIAHRPFMASNRLSIRSYSELGASSHYFCGKDLENSRMQRLSSHASSVNYLSGSNKDFILSKQVASSTSKRGQTNRFSSGSKDKSNSPTILGSPVSLAPILLQSNNKEVGKNTRIRSATSPQIVLGQSGSSFSRKFGGSPNKIANSDIKRDWKDNLKDTVDLSGNDFKSEYRYSAYGKESSEYNKSVTNKPDYRTSLPVDYRKKTSVLGRGLRNKNIFGNNNQVEESSVYENTSYDVPNSTKYNYEEFDESDSNVEDDSGTMIKEMYEGDTGIYIYIKASPKVKLGKVFPVNITIYNQFPTVLEGLSVDSVIGSSFDDTQSILENKNYNQDIFAIENKEIANIVNHKNNYPSIYEYSLMSIDQHTQIKPISPATSETISIRYFASNLGFASIGSIKLFKSKRKVDRNAVEGKENVERILIAEFETPIIVFVE
ncbi:hypothetical protein BB559_003232 [Furculomyces boomerangus]|uniref:Uncharacterized protein n=1 Tax=Furculomyces boomerangus TaxID=61424 RepID=A0A2T9YMM2_9FUNG|nr:hypothetical protein BB559_003232 [Furculomyces boomerangus]